MKKLIGSLPLNKKYEVIELSYSSKDNDSFCTCDNCGKLISNIATIKDDDGKIFNVGLDCSTTMQLYQNNATFNLLEAKKILRRRAKFVKWFTVEYKSHIIENNGVWFYDKITDKWSSNWVYRMTLENISKNYPSIYNKIIKQKYENILF